MFSRLASRFRRNRHERRAAIRGRNAIRVAAASLIAAASLAAHEAHALWTNGNGAGTYDATTLSYGFSIDFNNDYAGDIFLQSAGFGGDVQLFPQTVGGVDGRAFTVGANVLRWAATADDVLAFPGSQGVETPDFATLWSESLPATDFETRGFAGVRFEIPGGSPYLAYLDLEVLRGIVGFDEFEQPIYSGFGYLVIHEVGYQLVPEPGVGTMLLGGLGALGWYRRRTTRV